MPDAVLESMPSTKQLVSRALGNLGMLAPKLVNTPALSFNARPPAGLQKMIVGEVMDNKRQVVYESLSIEQRSEHRKCGGVGSGGFLLVPETGQSPMAAGAWRMALRRRLLYDAAALVHPSKPETQCQHRGRHGVCGEALDTQRALQHPCSCKVGGHVVEAHDAVRDVLWNFAKERVDPGALREQRLEALRGQAEMDRGGEPEDADEEEEEGGGRKDILDVVWTEDGRTVAIDVAIVGANADRGRLQAAASKDGVAARRAERGKRLRYEGLPITPFVLEIGGRPGQAAIGVVRALAARAGQADASRVAAALWQQISIALQTGVGRTIASSLVAPCSVAAAGAA